jgi:hypothetical protein
MDRANPHMTKFGFTCALGLIIAAFVLLVSPLRAQEFWNERKSSEWTEREAMTVIAQSPWAKRAKVKNAPLPGQSIPPGNRDETPSHVMGTRGRPQAIMDQSAIYNLERAVTSMLENRGSDGGSNKDSAGQNDTNHTVVFMPAGEVIVLWESALPVREAETRLGLKDSVGQHSAESFVISVIGFPVNFEKGQVPDTAERSKKWIIECAVLSHKGKDSITPTDVDVTEVGEDSVLRFFFPRDSAIEAKNKAITFRMELGPNLVQAEFNPKQMLYQGKPAL